MATLPILNPDKTYGDQTALDSFKKSTKPLPISGAPAPRRGPGRPTGATAAPQAPPGAGGQLSPEHRDLMGRLRDAEEVADYWQEMAQTAPSQIAQMMAKRATQVRDTLALKIYHDTPNFF